jgi:hypothetical protein
MTLLGKIFTVCILIASLFLMFVAMVVYATHTNWQTEYKTLQATLQTERTAKEEQETTYTDMVNNLKAEREAALQDVRKLETERDALFTQNTNIQKTIDQLRQNERTANEMVKATEENNNRLTEEVANLRESIRENQRARDQAFASTLKATSDLHVARGELQSLKERGEQLTEDLARVTANAREGGVDPQGNVVPRVRGLVSALRRDSSGQLIEITIGADDGVRPGHTVEVFRGERYLGRAEILKADPDRAVGRVIREFQQGQIQEGDDVATKLRVG